MVKFENVFNKKINLKNETGFYWSLVAALAGFLFGFDTVVISGADKKLKVYGALQMDFTVL